MCATTWRRTTRIAEARPAHGGGRAGPAGRAPRGRLAGRLAGALALALLAAGPAAEQALAQDAGVGGGAVQGRVWDASGVPVSVALVAFRAGDGRTVARTETSATGFYRLHGLPAGRGTLVVMALGYEERRIPVDIPAGGRRTLDVTLRTRALEVEGLVVEARRARERARFEVEAGLTARELSADDLRLLPGFVETDPLRAAETLPGVTTANDFTAAFNVRGGSADQNLILVDGQPVFNPTHLGGLVSIFNADLVRSAELRVGGFGAEYGGRVSSVLAVETDPGDGRFSAAGALSLLNARVALGGSLPEGVRKRMGLRSARWRLGGRRSYLDIVTAPFFDFPYRLADLQGVLEAWTRGGDRLRLSLYSGGDVLDLTTLDADDFPLRVDWRWGNDALSASWTVLRRQGGWVEIGAGGSRFDTGLRFPDFDDTDFRSRIDQVGARVSAEMRAGAAWRVRAGGAIERFSYDNLALSGGTEFAGGAGRGVLTSAFAQGARSGSGPWRLEVGARLDWWAPSPGPSAVEVSPRIAVKRFFGSRRRVALKAAAGRYTQFLHSIRDEALPLGLDIWVLAGERAPHVVSDQVQAGIEVLLDEGWSASLEAYRRTFDGVITNNVAENPNDPLDDLLAGSGRSWGVDAYLARTRGDTRGWVSVSWLRATRTFPDVTTGLDPAPALTYPPVFDRRVDVDLVVTRRFGERWEAGLRWNLGTGLPFTRPRGVYPFLTPRVDDGRLEWDVDAPGRDLGLVLGPRNGARLPMQHRLDVSVRRRVERSWGVMTPYLSVLNLYNRRNVLFYFFEYDRVPPVRSGFSMFPLVPTFGLEVSFR
ncbi:MAG: hypothetical protein D6701_11235 [Gemmatimonadetes bacterium]|nr:MAG: hypothetical protein D6701_11235 [Gemmatimonadota bacterium]